MTTHKARINAELALRDNADYYRKKHGHEPYFTLTAAGAKALKQYIVKNEVDVFMLGGNGGRSSYSGIETKALRQFLKEELKMNPKRGALDTENLSQFLGVASVGANVNEGIDRIAVDPEVLDALAEPKKTRQRS